LKRGSKYSRGRDAKTSEICQLLLFQGLEVREGVLAEIKERYGREDL
jgi:hypothetical protein